MEHPHGYTSASSSSWDQTDTAWCKAPPWPTVSTDYLVYFKAPRKQRHSHEARYSRSCEVIAQELVKGQAYLRNVRHLNKPGLLSLSFTTHVKAILSSRAMDWIWRETPVLRTYKLHFPPYYFKHCWKKHPCTCFMFTDNISWKQWQEPSFRNKNKKSEIFTYVTFFERKSIYNANH